MHGGVGITKKGKAFIIAVVHARCKICRQSKDVRL